MPKTKVRGAARRSVQAAPGKSKRKTAEIDRLAKAIVQSCRICGCTFVDCEGCLRRTGRLCSWIGPDLCSACVMPDDGKDFRLALSDLYALWLKELDKSGPKLKRMSPAGRAFREILMLRGVT